MNQNYALLITAVLSLGISAGVAVWKPEAGVAIAKQAENLISGCIGALGSSALQKYSDNLRGKKDGNQSETTDISEEILNPKRPVGRPPKETSGKG